MRLFEQAMLVVVKETLDYDTCALESFSRVVSVVYLVIEIEYVYFDEDFFESCWYQYLCYQKTTQRHLFKQHLIKGALNYNQLPLAFEAKKMSLSHWTSFHGNEKRGSWRQGRHWEHFSWQFAVHLRLHHSFKIRIFFLLLLFFASSYFSFAFKHNLTFICIIIQKERRRWLFFVKTCFLSFSCSSSSNNESEEKNKKKHETFWEKKTSGQS